MTLAISQTHAQLGVDRTPSRLDIETRSARLEFSRKNAVLNIRTELPRVEIDSYECRASAGLKNNLDLMSEMAGRAYQNAIEYIGKVAEDGDTFAAIERGGNPIADMAERDAYPEYQSNIDFTPKARPKIEVKGNIEIDVETNAEGIHNGVEFNCTPGEVNINYTPSKVNIYMKQYPSISFEYKGNNIDKRL